MITSISPLKPVINGRVHSSHSTSCSCRVALVITILYVTTKKEEQDFDYDKWKTSMVTRHRYSVTVEIPKALGINEESNDCFFYVSLCIKTKIRFITSGISDHNRFLLSCLSPLAVLLPNTIKLFGFPIF